MTTVNVTSVNVLDNPSTFTNPLQFEIQYECLYQLRHDLEWKLTYVGSAETEKYDQVLDTVLVGPVYPGQYRFVFQADPPDASKLPQDDIVGVTVILLTCSYNGKEFVRVGYYVVNNYTEEELQENPPEKPQIDRLSRHILADKLRVTRFPIEFDPPEEVPLAGAATPHPAATAADSPLPGAAASTPFPASTPAIGQPGATPFPGQPGATPFPGAAGPALHPSGGGFGPSAQGLGPPAAVPFNLYGGLSGQMAADEMEM